MSDQSLGRVLAAVEFHVYGSRTGGVCLFKSKSLLLFHLTSRLVQCVVFDQRKQSFFQLLFFFQGNASQWEAAGKVGVGRNLFLCIYFFTDMEVSRRWNWTQARLTSFAIRARAGTLMFA